MTATTEIRIIDFVKSVKKNSEEDHSVNSEHLLNLIEKFEDVIIQYFTYNSHINFNESFVDLFDIVYKLRIISVSLFLNDDEVKTKLQDENFINNTIIDVFQNNSVKLDSLNLSFIKTLEFSRDKNLYSNLSKMNLDEFNRVYHSSLLSNEIKHNENFHQIIHDKLNDNLKLEIDKFKDLLFASLAVEFAAFLYYLIDEKKISFEGQRLGELVEFNAKSLLTFRRKYGSFERYQHETELAEQVNHHVSTLTKFIERNHLPLTAYPGLNEAIHSVINLKDLEEGWDEEDTPPIAHDYISKGVGIICDIYIFFQKVPSFTAPTAYSGVLIEYSFEGNRLDIRIGDEDHVIMNYFENKALSWKRVPYNIDTLNQIWKRSLMK